MKKKDKILKIKHFIALYSLSSSMTITVIIKSHAKEAISEK